MTHRKPLGGKSFQECYFPMAGLELIKERANSLYKQVDITQEYIEDCKKIAVKAKKMHDSTDFAIVQSHFIAMIVTPIQVEMTYQDWYMNLALNAKDLKYVTEKYFYNIVMPKLEIYFQEIGKYVDVAYCIGDDLSDQRGPSFSVEQYRKIFKPMHKKIIDTVKKYSNTKIIFHICGSAYEFIADIIDIGADAICPVQTTAANMSPERLKKEFGKDITLWGGLDTQQILTRGTKQQVIDEVKHIAEVFGKDGGFVFAPCHNIQSGTPVENIVAMFETINHFNQ